MNKFIIDALYIYNDFNNLKYTAWVIIVSMTSLFYFLDELVYWYMIMPRITVHYDLFNFGIIIGIFFKNILYLYFNGFILYANYFAVLKKIFLPM